MHREQDTETDGNRSGGAILKLTTEQLEDVKKMYVDGHPLVMALVAEVEESRKAIADAREILAGMAVGSFVRVKR